MYNLNTEFQTFYTNHVRLSSESLRELRSIRSKNEKRLKEGLAEINEEDSTNYKIKTFHTQGSTAMFTQTQNDEGEYDIDIATVFEEGKVPQGPLPAKRLVERALKKKCSNFSDPPTAGTNAVCVTYRNGYHLDFAVYREVKDTTRGTYWEHAGATWTERDPRQITKWFNAAVRNKSPKGEFEGIVKPNQMRRIVQFLKMFCKSRSGWSMPGGLILTTLVEESYVSDFYRDDLCLYNTLCKIRDRLIIDQVVNNPVLPSQALTHNNKHQTKVKNLCNRLKEYVAKLDALFNTDLTHENAKRVWKDFFNHKFWTPAENQSRQMAAFEKSVSDLSYLLEERLRSSASLHVSVMATIKGESFAYEAFTQNGKKRHVNKLPKNASLKFQAFPLDVQQPYNIKWIVNNEGDEAKSDNSLTHESLTDSRDTSHTEKTLYRGKHKMTCQIIKGENVVAEKEIPIIIR